MCLHILSVPTAGLASRVNKRPWEASEEIRNPRRFDLQAKISGRKQTQFQSSTGNMPASFTDDSLKDRTIKMIPKE